MRPSLLLICFMSLPAVAQAPCLRGQQVTLALCRDLGDLPECVLERSLSDGGLAREWVGEEGLPDAGADCVPLQQVDLRASGVELALRVRRPAPTVLWEADGGMLDPVLHGRLSCGRTLELKQRGARRAALTFAPSCGAATDVTAWRIPRRDQVFLVLRFPTWGYEGSYVNDWPLGLVPLSKPRPCKADGGCAVSLPPLGTALAEEADFAAWAALQARDAGQRSAAEAWAAEADQLRAYEQGK